MDKNKKLSKLFDYQKVAGNSHLDKLISETEERYAMAELDMDDLGMVNAAKMTERRSNDSFMKK